MPYTPHAYSVANNIFSINCADDVKSWEKLEWRFQPFIVESQNPQFSIDILHGRVDTTGYKEIFFQESTDVESGISHFEDEKGNLIFTIEPPSIKRQAAMLMCDPEFKKMSIVIEENIPSMVNWHREITLNSCLMLAFLMGTTPYDTLLSHASSVLHDGKAYLFIAKSGTGKSTHAQLWLKHIANCTQLNDDHPIVRIYDTEPHVIAYGSPWSGKTHCYRNLQAPVGAIVRIKRASFNAIHRLSPVQAYASLSTSFSGIKWLEAQADLRHASIERLIQYTPCYTLECLPNQEAAEVCHAEVTKIHD